MGIDKTINRTQTIGQLNYITIYRTLTIWRRMIQYCVVDDTLLCG